MNPHPKGLGNFDSRSAAEHREALRRLYPALSEDQLTEAQENLDRYLQTVLRIFERVRDDPDFPSRLEQFERERQELLSEIRKTAGK